MSFTIKLCHNKSPAEKIGKTIDTGTDITGCSLKERTSILRPVIFITSSAADITNYNYMYIAQFERYYFIDDIVSVNNNKWEISAHVDVLETYKNSILANSAVIRRQENRYNLYLDDSEFKVYNGERIQTLKFSSTGFSKSLSYALIVNGS